MKDAAAVKAVGFDRYFKAGSWEESNRAFFDGLAPKYDRLNVVISLGQQQRYKQAAVSSLNLKPGMRVLDICTGSGDLFIEMTRQCRGLHLDAVDMSGEMLRVAKERARRSNIHDISFYQASALALPFEEHTFDAIAMGFGLRNLGDIPAGIKEMHRVLKPGGVFTTLDLGKPKAGLPRWLHHVYFDRLMPFLGRAVFHRHEFNSFEYLSRSSRYFPVENEIMAMMSGAGFRDVHGKSFMLGGVAYQSGAK
ncbi:MAG: class I SAM-dependent methyltransferase [Candidatus Omnitrophota bacterium]